MAAVTYQQVKSLKHKLSVGLNEVEFTPFGNETGIDFLLSAELNSRFGVAIVSRSAGILGHIPRPNTTECSVLVVHYLADITALAAPYLGYLMCPYCEGIDYSSSSSNGAYLPITDRMDLSEDGLYRQRNDVGDGNLCQADQAAPDL